MSYHYIPTRSMICFENLAVSWLRRTGNEKRKENGTVYVTPLILHQMIFFVIIIAGSF